MTPAQTNARQLLQNALLGDLLMESINAALDTLIHATDAGSLIQAQTAYHALVDLRDILYEKASLIADDADRNGPFAPGGRADADDDAGDWPGIPRPRSVRASFGFGASGPEPGKQ